MIIFVATVLVFASAIAGLALGVIISDRKLKGTCGGLGNMTDSAGKTLCDACVSSGESTCQEDEKAHA